MKVKSKNIEKKHSNIPEPTASQIKQINKYPVKYKRKKETETCSSSFINLMQIRKFPFRKEICKMWSDKMLLSVRCHKPQQ